MHRVIATANGIAAMPAARGGGTGRLADRRVVSCAQVPRYAGPANRPATREHDETPEEIL